MQDILQKPFFPTLNKGVSKNPDLWFLHLWENYELKKNLIFSIVIMGFRVSHQVSMD